MASRRPTTPWFVDSAPCTTGCFRANLPAVVPRLLRRSPAPPRPAGLPGVGHLLRLRHNPVRFLYEAMRECGDIAELRFGPVRALALFHPRHVEHVLQKNHRAYDKRSRVNAVLRSVAGEGIINAEGERWVRQRRVALQILAKKRVQGLLPIMARHAARSAEELGVRAAGVTPIDATEAMMRLTLPVITEVLFSTDLSGELDEVLRALAFLSDDLAGRSLHLLSVPRAIPTGKNRRFVREVAVLDRIILGELERRRAEGGDYDDFFATMLAIRGEGETGARLTDEDLRNELMHLMLAGHETTAGALVWMLYVLASDPDLDRRVHAELAAELGDEPPTVERLAALDLLPRFVHESLRLYPSVWLLARRAITDDEIDGYPVPEGTLVMLPLYAIHRHPDFWPDAERFDPDRFVGHPGGKGFAHRYQYVPFGAGPRACAGDHFGLLEIQTVLATLLRRLRFSLADPGPVEPTATITMRPAGGLRLHVTHRGQVN